nr:DUF5682 family protein [Candidatus Sigynarchaeota archaeon]
LSKGFIVTLLTRQHLQTVGTQQVNVAIMDALAQRSYYQACMSLPHAANPPDDIEKELVDSAKNMTMILNNTDVKIDEKVLIDSINITIQVSDNDFLKGCFTGLLYLMGNRDIRGIKKAIVEYILSADAIKIKVGEFIRGLVYECQATFLFNPEIVSLLADIIERVRWGIFTAILPSLRKTFSELDNHEYDVFVNKLAEIYGMKPSSIKELVDEIKEEYLVFFLDIDKKVREIYKKWILEK